MIETLAKADQSKCAVEEASNTVYWAVYHADKDSWTAQDLSLMIETLAKADQSKWAVEEASQSVQQALASASRRRLRREVIPSNQTA